jgi:hypothetical protein
MTNWKADNVIEVIEEGDSRHHLFNYREVKNKIISLFGEPKTDKEHKILSERCRKVMNKMPVFIIDSELHENYERKIKELIK